MGLMGKDIPKDWIMNHIVCSRTGQLQSATVEEDDDLFDKHRIGSGDSSKSSAWSPICR